MKEGNIVTFKKEPTKNTPGVCEDALIFGIEFTGVVVAASIEDQDPTSLVDSDKWCEVLWSNNQVTRCYKDDLRVWKPRRRRPQMRCVKNEKRF